MTRPGKSATADGVVVRDRTRVRRDHDQPLEVLRPGTLDYHTAWDLQRELVELRQRDEGRDTLILLEHPPVYTLGTRTDRSHVLFDATERAARGIELVEVDRGGDVTYHGPGQLVGYPIVRLANARSVVDYVRTLEEILISALADLDVRARRIDKLTGVWVDDAKIAAIGVRVASGGITSHGFALNVAPDLTDFTGIVPCGITDRSVCSLASLGVTATIDHVADHVEAAVARILGATLESAVWSPGGPPGPA